MVGAMGAQNAMNFFKPGVLLITPGRSRGHHPRRRTSLDDQQGKMMAGIVLTGNLRPSASVLKVIRAMPIPVLLAARGQLSMWLPKSMI